jgi:hypothetical protein
MDFIAEKYAERLLAATVAGINTSHGARGNLEKIHMLLEGNSSTTFGMEDLLRGVTYEEAYGAVAERIGNPPDREENAGRGCIDPSRTAAGLLEAGGRIRAVAEGGGSAVFATGHPGALLVYYLGLASWFEELGGKALLTEPRIKPDDGGPPLDWVGPVAVLGDGASLRHTHDPAPMRRILDEIGAPDLVVADHGFAGAAVAVGIPTVAIMDTNDPALAVVALRGAEGLTVIPMDDNRPQNSYAAALEVLQVAL